MTDLELLEKIAQMLYDKAELMSTFEDEAITDEMKLQFRTKCFTYCNAAEDVRMMKEELS